MNVWMRRFAWWRLRGKSRREIFTHHYHTNFWGSEESRSGPGSTLSYTAPIRHELPGLLTELKVRVLLDAPCGDFNWMKHTHLRGVSRYIGGDIVPDLVERLEREFGKESRTFVVLDIVTDKIPAADLWLCRDVLFHFCNADALRVVDNFLASGIPWLLTSSHPHGQNSEIRTGGFRLLNLERPPFCFPSASRYLMDSCVGFPERVLGLWHRDAIASVWRR